MCHGKDCGVNQFQLRSKRESTKSEYKEYKQQCEEALLRDTELQASNRILRSKLIKAESQLMELSESVEKGTEGVIEQHRITLLTESNKRLLELLKLVTGLQQIPYIGTDNVIPEFVINLQYISQLESEYSQAIRSLHDERSQRRTVEDQLIELKAEYEQLKINYHKLVNPVEQLECDVAMQQEPDTVIVRAALEEKLHHLMELGKQLEERDIQHDQDRHLLLSARERTIALEELIAKQDSVGLKADFNTQDARQKVSVIQILENELKQKRETLEESERLCSLISTELKSLQQVCEGYMIEILEIPK